MMQALHGNGVKLILVEKLDRLARDLMIQETIIGDLRKYGFELVSVAEPDLCRDDPTRKLMRQIFGAISEYEKTMIVIKLRGARQRKKARTGRCEGRKPYGHYPGEKSVVERMRALRKEGLGFDRLAVRLNEEGDGLARVWGESDFVAVVALFHRGRVPDFPYSHLPVPDFLEFQKLPRRIVVDLFLCKQVVLSSSSHVN